MMQSIQLKRLENQIEALRRAELVILEEMVNLYHRETISDHSLARLMGQIQALKALKVHKNGDRPQ